MEQGRIFSAELSDNSDLYSWIDSKIEVDQQSILLFSRQPHKRLLEYFDVTKIEAYWLSERVTAGALEPSLEKIAHLIASKLQQKQGLIVVEGLEWLVSLHGHESVLAFIRQIRDEVYQTQWNIIFPINCLVFDSVWLARLRREAPNMEIFAARDENIKINLEEINVEEDTSQEVKIHNFQEVPGEEIELDTRDDGTPKLVMLTRLPFNGFSKSILTRRILQWRRMGLDVSEVEPALAMLDENLSYELYALVEEKVRRAVELENYLDTYSDNISASELATARFRIRQLTGLDEIEKWILEM